MKKKYVDKLERDILKILSSGGYWGILEINILTGADKEKIQKTLDKLASEGKIVKHKYLYSIK